MRKFVVEKRMYYGDVRGWRLMEQRVVYALDKISAVDKAREMWGWEKDEETSILTAEVHA